MLKKAWTTIGAGRAITAVLSLTVLWCVGGCSGNVSDTPHITIAGASDLEPVLPELIALHNQQHTVAITTVLGSSGLLARQLAQQAPFDLFFSANERFVDELVEAGHGRPDRRILYARGRLTVWTPGSAIETLNDLQHP
ncbi:MAG: hypothetical protein EA401_11085, partial [Planctomycetota bacterium]